MTLILDIYLEVVVYVTQITMMMELILNAWHVIILVNSVKILLSSVVLLVYILGSYKLQLQHIAYVKYNSFKYLLKIFFHLGQSGFFDVS